MPASPPDTRALVMHYLQVLAARDVAGLVACFADSVDWDVPGAQALAPWLGRRRRRAEVQEFFELLFAHTVPADAHLEYLLVEGSVAIATGTFSSTMVLTGRQLTSPFFIQLTTEQGKIVRYRLLEDTWAVVRALT